MEIFVKIVQFVLSLSILVICHEMGHFLFAKLFKTRVEKFYIFFNPWFSLFKFKRGETEYGMGWLPLGGYVKIAGMIDESMDTEQMKQPAQPWEFRSKPAWQRLLIMVGGVLMNVIVAFMIYIGILYTWGETYLPAKNVTYGVVCDPIFTEMGVEKGDIIVALDHRELERFTDILPELLLEKPQTMQVLRNGQEVSLQVPDDLVANLLELSSRSFSLNPLLTPRYPVNGVVIGDFADYSVAYDAGMRKGDTVLAVNGQGFRFYDEFTEICNEGLYVVGGYSCRSEDGRGPAGFIRAAVEIVVFTRGDGSEIGRGLCDDSERVPGDVELAGFLEFDGIDFDNAGSGEYFAHPGIGRRACALFTV